VVLAVSLVIKWPEAGLLLLIAGAAAEPGCRGMRGAGPGSRWGCRVVLTGFTLATPKDVGCATCCRRWRCGRRRRLRARRGGECRQGARESS